MAPRVLILCTMSLLLAAGGHRRTYKCLHRNQPVNCVNNPRIRITKSDHYYYIDILQLKGGIKWISCNRICQYCNLLRGQALGCETLNKMKCEQEADNFLNSYCKNITLAVNATAPSFSTPNATTTVSPQPETQDLEVTPFSTATLTTTVSPSCSRSQQPSAYQPACICTSSAMPMESPSLSSSSLESTEKSDQTTCMNSAMALGVLLALSVVLLAVVTTGWVCTCLITKKRQSPPQNSKEININNEDDKDGERVFQNPTYEETSATQPLTSSYAELSGQDNPSVATYDTVKPPSQATTENGSTYDVLNRGQADGNHPARDTGKPTKDETYSKLGLHS